MSSVEKPRMTTESPWQIDQLDLDGYLARLQLKGAGEGPTSRVALDALHEAHVRTFTFDNIDVLLEQHPGVELPDVQAKFVGRGRGGYCFEHATFFAAVLGALGYHVERRLARVGDRDGGGPDATAWSRRGRRHPVAVGPRFRPQPVAPDSARGRGRRTTTVVGLPRGRVDPPAAARAGSCSAFVTEAGS